MYSILGQTSDFTLFIVFHIFLCHFGTKKKSLNFQTCDKINMHYVCYLKLQLMF